jgi:hypothetical protein
LGRAYQSRWNRWKRWNRRYFRALPNRLSDSNAHAAVAFPLESARAFLLVVSKGWLAITSIPTIPTAFEECAHCPRPGWVTSPALATYRAGYRGHAGRGRSVTGINSGTDLSRAASFSAVRISSRGPKNVFGLPHKPPAATALVELGGKLGFLNIPAADVDFRHAGMPLHDDYCVGSASEPQRAADVIKCSSSDDIFRRWWLRTMPT